MEAPKEEDALSLAEYAVDFALKNGADEAESFVHYSFTRTVSIERRQITKSASMIDRGIGIRVLIKNALGFAYTNTLEEKEDLKTAVLKALKSARSSLPDKCWQGLPSKKSFTDVAGIFDQKILNLSSEELVKAASTMLESAEKTDKRVFPVEGSVGVSHVCNAIVNSHGISGFDQGTIAECSLATVAREKGNVSPICFEFNMERSYTLNPEWVGHEAAKLAASSLKAKNIETKYMKVILTQFALQQLLTYTMLNAIKADHVQRNQSALKGKIGEKVASEIITVYDDGIMEGGIHTWRFDGEGVPRQKTPIIERGILRNFIYDNYTAKKEGRESTGNSTRAGYLSTPTIEPTNFHITPGTTSPEELMGNVDEALLVYSVQGAHSSNPASGEFSVVATPAFKVKNGKIEHAAREVMLAGNIFET
ncbi:MAG: TldD/PmbA family protein, partial [Candidatus Bathyarchaeia archaeon]